MSGPDEGVGFLVNDVACGSGARIHFYDAQALMAAVHLFISEATLVAAPMQARRLPFVLEPLHCGLHSAKHRLIKNAELVFPEFITGQSVGTLFQDRSAAARL